MPARRDDDLAQVLRAIQAIATQPQPAPPSNEKEGLAKHASTIIVALVIALCAWVGTSVNSLSNTVTRISANVDQLQKSISDLQTSQGSAATQLADGKATDARQDARMDALEADMGRMKERIRIVEGQKPIETPAGH